MVKTYEITLETEGFCDIHDITDTVREKLKDSKLNEGMCLVKKGLLFNSKVNSL